MTTARIRASFLIAYLTIVFVAVCRWGGLETETRYLLHIAICTVFLLQFLIGIFYPPLHHRVSLKLSRALKMVFYSLLFVRW
jgi:hypothetical protein